MFTDPPDFPQYDRRYAVPPPVRVRKESFGLLFYSTLDSRLTFVKSEDLLQVEALPGGPKLLITSREPASRSKIKKLLDRLLEKGLVCED